ncbi:MAG: histidinol dehydrogenase [Lachnospiraceae bacterium]|jgi:histidinol dehydrogenase|nr:histidinol dehydrogenase [Lachnospiraceae bacterium]
MELNRDLNKVKSRKIIANKDIVNSVSSILSDIEIGGMEKVLEYAKNFDGFTGNPIVTVEEIKEAMNSVGENFINILKKTKERIAIFHENQIEKSWNIVKEDGSILGQVVRPLRKVGLYVPGGTATYPSTVLMNAVPAKLAGVKELIAFTPVKSDGKVSDVILSACTIAGVDKIIKIGGVQGIGMAAYVEKVDKIVGPGNAYVAEAKKQVYGKVGIDMIAGPSEILIIADENANPKYVAADLMSQSEHDKMASGILLTTSKKLIEEVEEEIDSQMSSLNRKDILLESLSNYGAAIIVSDLKEAFDISNDIAPEHLEIMVADPISTLPYVENAGSIFLGENSPEPFGDYMSGTNHVLPTGGTAKFYSPLGVYDFIKRSSYSYYPKEVLNEFKDDIITFANLEGLDAHANSIKVRYE